jgi:hypothetical protein
VAGRPASASCRPSWPASCGFFAFSLGDRHFGVLTASVGGTLAGQLVFTGSLPVALLRLLAPTLETRLRLTPST